MDIVYDIAVIGLGAAGATLARLLDPKFKIIAIDKKSETDNSFRKPCGGLLATDAQKALSKFDLTLPKRVLVDPQIFAVKTIDLKRRLSRYYQRFYINLDRHKFDLWLISLIPKTVDIKSGAVCKEIKALNSAYEITYTQNGNQVTTTAKYIVGADGANSIVRKKLSPHRKTTGYISIQKWFREEHQNPFYSCIFDKELTSSYCWSISKDGYFIVGGAFPKQNGRQKFDLMIEKLKNYGFEFGEYVKTEACLVTMPRGIRDFHVGYGNMFLIGEAAGFISPTSLEGISYSLNSANNLAKILNSRCKNPDLKIRIKSIPMRLKLLLKYIKAPFMYNSFLRFLIMKSRIKSIKTIK